MLIQDKSRVYCQGIIDIRRKRLLCFLASHNNLYSFLRPCPQRNTGRVYYISSVICPELSRFLGWLTDPGCSLSKGSNCRQSASQNLTAKLNDASNGCCWPRFQIRSPHIVSNCLSCRFVTSTHLAPSCCEPGWVSYPRPISHLDLPTTLKENTLTNTPAIVVAIPVAPELFSTSRFQH